VLVGLDIGTSGASAVDVDESLVAIHTDDCEVGNVSVPDTFRGHKDLREFWTSSRSTFGEMRPSFETFSPRRRGRLSSRRRRVHRTPRKPPTTA